MPPRKRFFVEPSHETSNITASSKIITVADSMFDHLTPFEPVAGCGISSPLTTPRTTQRLTLSGRFLEVSNNEVKKSTRTRVNESESATGSLSRKFRTKSAVGPRTSSSSIFLPRVDNSSQMESTCVKGLLQVSNDVHKCSVIESSSLNALWNASSTVEISSLFDQPPIPTHVALLAAEPRQVSRRALDKPFSHIRFLQELLAEYEALDYTAISLQIAADL